MENRKAGRLLVTELHYAWKRETAVAAVVTLLLILISFFARGGADAGHGAYHLAEGLIVELPSLFVTVVLGLFLLSFYAFSFKNKKNRREMFIRISGKEYKSYLMRYLFIKSAFFAVLIMAMLLLFCGMFTGFGNLTATQVLSLLVGLVLFYMIFLYAGFLLMLSELTGKWGMIIKVVIVVMAAFNFVYNFFNITPLEVFNLRLIFDRGPVFNLIQFLTKLISILVLYLIIRFGVHKNACVEPD
jgi:hypothetical protein